MLHAWRHPRTGKLRLYVHLALPSGGLSPVEAWISPRPAGSRSGTDWALWVRRGAAPATSEKCPLRLEIESRLRAWLLRRYRRRLFATSFRELCEVARARGASHRAVVH